MLPLKRERRSGARRAAVDHRPMVLSRRAHVPVPGRFADGLPLAARLAALGVRGATTASVEATRSRRAARCPPAPTGVRAAVRAACRWRRACAAAAGRRRAGQASAAAARGTDRPWRRPAAGAAGAGQAGRGRCSDLGALAGALRVRALGHPHGAGASRRAIRSAPTAPRPKPRPGQQRALCLHAAAAARWRTTSSCSPRSRPPPPSLGVKIVLEGYPPPRDPRLKMLQVTPDPGVIEVNIHPAHDWRELVEHTEFLYDAAWQSRLSTEKFMLDGRHTGTGGGNHFVLGGATPADSPFLRRPDLLGSSAGLLAQPPVAELSVLGPVHRAHQPGAARRRGAQRPALRTRDRAGRDRSQAATSMASDCRRGWSTARCATC